MEGKRETKREKMPVAVMLIVTPLSFVCSFTLIHIGWTNQYLIIPQMLLGVIGLIPYVIALICYFDKEMSVKIFTIISMFILAGVVFGNMTIIGSALFGGYRRPPVIQTGSFPFRVVYELDGEVYVIEDTLVCNRIPARERLNETSPTWRPSLEENGAINRADIRDALTILTLENWESTFNGRVVAEYVIHLSPGHCDYYMGTISGWTPYHNQPTFMGGNRTLTIMELEEHFGIIILEFEFTEPFNRFRQPD